MDFTPCKSFQRDDLEVTRNPFDSREFDKENLPAFSPSIFIVSASRSSEKKNKSFRWSIDQIAALKPAEIDEFPNQEYSRCYDREEDELAAQDAINEYFSTVTLPSPWMRNKAVAFKRVTFSPNPPTYYKESSYDSNKSSKDSSLSTSQNEEETRFVDCSCQTALSIPANFDLEQLLGDKFFTFNESEGNPSCSKELNISTLRRKLFSQGDPSPGKEASNDIEAKEIGLTNNQRPEVRSINSTPRTPRTPNWVTSSPFRDQNIHKTPLKTQVSDSESVLQSSFVGDPWNSPVLSPIKEDNSYDIALSFTRIDSPDTSFDLSELSIEKNVVNSDLEMSRNDEEIRAKPFDGEIRDEPFDIQRDANTMSVERSELVLDIKESTRLPLIEFTGFSPIRNEDDMEISVVSSSKYEDDIRFNGNSIKESTANYMHGISGICSPISRSKQMSVCGNFEKNSLAITDIVEEVANDSIDDGGPLDITDLSIPIDQSSLPKEDDIDDVSDEVFQAPVVIVSPYPTPKRGILKHSTQKDKVVSEKEKVDYRFDDLEQRISHVDHKVESVRSHCENGIREIKRSLTPAIKQFSCSSNVDQCRVVGNRKTYPSQASDDSVSSESLRAFDYATKRKPLQDRTNTSNPKIARDGPFITDDSESRETIVRRGYSALNRAKTVQQKIDEEFDFFPNSNSQEKHLTSIDTYDNEIVSILNTDEKGRATFYRNGFHCLEKDCHSNIRNEKRFNDYRLQTARESLNDSWDQRSKGAIDIAEMDNSVISPTTIDGSTPTPIMTLEGLSIYNRQKENAVNTLPASLAIDRRQTRESGKIERRQTWPSTKPTRHISALYIGSNSPPLPAKMRNSKWSFSKQDTVNKIREEFKIRPSSRTGFSTLPR